MSILSNVKAVFFDCDGVLTDGKISFDADGRSIRTYDMQDGMGVTMLREAGIFVSVISSSYGGSIESRMKMLKIEHTYTGVKNKAELVKKVCLEKGFQLDEVAFVGDDIVDLSPMKLVGYPVAVANAVSSVKKVAAYVTERAGGSGAVRELANIIVGDVDSIKGEVRQ